MLLARPRLRTALAIASLAALLAAGAMVRRWGTSPSGPVGAGAQSPQDPFSFVIDVPAVVVDEAGVCTFEVPIENRTGEAVQFRSLSCGCTCTASQLAKQSLAPGESTTLRLSVHTGNKTGSNQFVCYLADHHERQWAAGVRVELLRSEGFDTDHVSFGQLKPGQSASRTIHFRQHALRGDQLPPVPTFTPEGPGLGIVVGEPVTKTANGSVCRETPVTCSATTSSTTGYTAVTVRSHRNGSPPLPATSLQIDWTVRAAIVASPPRIVFTDSRSGGSLTRRVVLRSSRGEAFRILRATVTDPAIHVTVPEGSAEGGQAVVEVELRGDVPAKTAAADLVVETDHPEGATLTIPVSILVLPEVTADRPERSAK